MPYRQAVTCESVRSLPERDLDEQGNTLDQNTYDKGLEIRTAVLGEEYVKAATAGVPAAVDSFRIARQTFAELDEA